MISLSKVLSFSLPFNFLTLTHWQFSLTRSVILSSTVLLLVSYGLHYNTTPSHLRNFALKTRSVSHTSLSSNVYTIQEILALQTATQPINNFLFYWNFVSVRRRAIRQVRSTIWFNVVTSRWKSFLFFQGKEGKNFVRMKAQILKFMFIKKYAVVYAKVRWLS